MEYMVFSSNIFLFFFLPITIIGYFLLRSIRIKNMWLFIISLFFYFLGGASFFPIILYSILLNYIGGYALDYARTSGRNKLQKFIFVFTLALNILSLGYWKYTGFLAGIVRDVTGWQFAIPQIILPIGISFFTFQGMSYVIDLYRGEIPVQKSFLKLGMYIALFPQLIAGPIVRYADIEPQLNDRKHCVNDMAAGIRVFTVGLAKKSIIANSVAVTADAIFDMHPCQNEPAVAWLGLLAYTLQLYYDFSGYSDMAVGLGKMFGFQLPRNFNYPFISCSGSELWRRWHISLSSWFRDYVYIPLGGNRKGNVYLNLFCVFLLTGLWHGASWNFVLWGVFWGIIVVTERYVSRHIKKELAIPKFFSWVYTMFLWMMGMVFFRTENMQECGQFFQSLFGMIKIKDAGFSLSYYLNKYELFIIILGLAAMLPVGSRCYTALKEKISETRFLLLENTATLFLFVITIIYVVTGTYNPFIYFQF